jgi:hypothetical protein
MRILAAIDQPEVIERILTALSLPSRAPPPVPPQPQEADPVDFLESDPSPTEP